MAAAVDDRHPGRIQVSSTKKPVTFYVNLAKRLLHEHGEVQLSALGMAVSAMVSVAEILKKEKLVVEKKLSTTMDALTDEGREKPVMKPKMEIVMGKSADFDRLFAEQEAARKERQEAAGPGATAAAEE